MSKYVDTIYVSGWQCSSTASTNNEPGPDLADYPYSTVPSKVDQLFRAQDFHSRKIMNKDPSAGDMFRPIIADGDTGHGGINSVMKLTKEFVEKGASGIHFEDQKVGSKKCGHLAGKVLVSIQEHIDRMIASRLQCDIMGSETVLIARTDAESAKYLDCNIDARDHPFILGTTSSDIKSFVDIQKESHNISREQWEDQAGVCTFGVAVEHELLRHNADQAKLEKWRVSYKNLSHPDARALAKSLGIDIFWCWEKPRSREGYYRIQGGLEQCISRGLHFSPYCDMLWMETSKPDLKEAESFAAQVKAVYPWMKFSYNLSPSFNWMRAGMSQNDLEQFCQKLGHAGYVWQFITLAGFHCNALAIDVFAKKFKERGIIAYVTEIQKKEEYHAVETLKHQTWSGTELIDKIYDIVSEGRISTKSCGAENTEVQFISKI
jgi:isocitrate lyase